VGFVTFFVYTLSVSARSDAYLTSKRDVITQDTPEGRNAFITSLVTSNYNGTAQVYNRIEPLYFGEFEKEEEFKLKFRIYSIVLLDDKVSYNGLVFMVTDLVIADSNVSLDGNQHKIITAKFDFSKSIHITKDETKMTHSVELGVAFDDSTRVGMITETALTSSENDKEKADIEKITLYYHTPSDNPEVKNDIPLLTTLQANRADLTAEADAFPSDLAKRSFDLGPERINLLKEYPNPVNNDIIYYSEGAPKELYAFNGKIWQFMIIEVLIVIVVTYLLFFNGYVMKLVREKRMHRKAKDGEELAILDKSPLNKASKDESGQDLKVLNGEEKKIEPIKTIGSTKPAEPIKPTQVPTEEATTSAEPVADEKSPSDQLLSTDDEKFDDDKTGFDSSPSFDADPTDDDKDK
jgi:hypothetical protein